jgi:hypothetical protein
MEFQENKNKNMFSHLLVKFKESLQMSLQKIWEENRQ